MIKVKTIPNSSRQKIEKISDIEYRVHLKSKAENNQANKELLKLLKEHFKKEIRILKGNKSRRKILDLKCR